MMDRQTLEPLLLILAYTGGIFAWALDRWLFCGIFGAEAGFIMALLPKPD